MLILMNMHANNEVGKIQPVKEIANIARQNNMTAAGTVRISTGKNTKMEEIDQALDIISNAVLKLIKENN
jgi:cysteine sulfinate desulfinase/cysteine desulfurase-like protein